MKLKNLLTPILCSSIVMAGTTYQTGDNIVSQINEGGVDQSAANRSVDPSHTSQNSAQFYEEVVYQHLLYNEKQNVEMQASTDGGYAEDIAQQREDARQKAFTERLALLKAQAKEDEKKTKQLLGYGQGYCYLDKEVIIERIATYAYLNCDFQPPFGKVTLAVSMVPDFYANAVIGNPLYVSKDDKRYPVKNGVVMTKDKNSVNLANFVNDNMTKKIAAEAGYKSVGIAAKQAQAFLEQKIAAGTEQNVTVAGGLNTYTTVATNTKEPNAADFLWVAGIEMASEISKIIGKNYIRTLPYTFKINKDSVFFADVQFADDINMEGYKIIQDNIIKVEPEFKEDGGLDFKNIEEVPVLNNHADDIKTNTKSSSYTLPPATESSSGGTK